MRVITDEDIYRALLGDVVIGPKYNSPIPAEYRDNKRDNTPSFSLWRKTDGTVIWRDWGVTDQMTVGNKALNLVQYMKGLSLDVHGYWDAKALMEKELKFAIMGKPLTQLKSRQSYDYTPYVETGDFRDFEMEYWQRFDFTSEDLTYESIYPAYKIENINNGHLMACSKPGDPAFIYWWKKNPSSYKLYRPLAAKKADKFRQHEVAGVIEGYSTLIKEFSQRGKPFKVVFGLSSTKDRMVTKRAMGPDYSAFNPRNEGDRNDIIAKAAEIKAMGIRVILLYDADDPGWDAVQLLGELAGFEYYDTRGKLFGHKDFADMKDTTRGNMTYKDIKQTILNLINNGSN